MTWVLVDLMLDGPPGYPESGRIRGVYGPWDTRDDAKAAVPGSVWDGFLYEVLPVEEWRP